MSRQDVENFRPSRIKLLGELAQKLGFTQAVLFSHCQETGTVVDTWGIDAERSAQAARGANTIKQGWGWPEDTIVESEKVKVLRDRIKELEAQVASGGLKQLKVPEMKPSVHVIEGTEFERGWGCRRDGYVAFITKEAAEAFIVDYDAKHNTSKHAPDEYTTYEYIGIKPCMISFYEEVAARKLKRFYRLLELIE